MDEVAVDVEQRRAVVLEVDEVALPEFVVERGRLMRPVFCENMGL
jgi:hypothetical protein